MELKSTGIVRAIDDLGRIVIPMEMRKTLAINIKNPLEFLTAQIDGAQVIVLRKYERGCIFCSELENVIEFKGKTVCKRCSQEISV